MKERHKKIMTEISSGKHKTARAAIAAATGKRPGQITNKQIERTIKSVHGAYLKALAKAGVTDEKSARVISEAMDAQSYTMTGIPYSNHKIRLDANEQYLKVKRLMEPEDQANAPVNVSVTVEILDENNPAQESGNRISQFIQV